MWPTDLYQVVLQFWHVAHSWLEGVSPIPCSPHLQERGTPVLVQSTSSVSISLFLHPSDAGLVTSSNRHTPCPREALGWLEWEQLTNLSQAGWQQRKESRHEGKSSRIDISWVYCGGQSSSKTWLGEPTSSSLGSAALGSVGRCGVKELARLTANHHNQGEINVETTKNPLRSTRARLALTMN